ncbi:organic cation transporter protein-like [Macrobrachium nipponense]|uniref:organic cation transporter protein-like n=1 Tax=Macrobrachium nipponense TaxID=159736 RepID=UPI0030C7C03F
MTNKIDDLLTQLGTGRWNALHFFITGYCMGLTTYHALAAAFLTPNVDYTCISALTGEEEEGGPPIHLGVVKDIGYLNDSRRDECIFVVENPNNGTYSEFPCSEWHFDNSTFSSTITSEFKLTCDRQHLRAWYQSIYMSGIFIGGLCCAFLADKYGRKRIIVFGLMVYVSLGLLTSWLRDLSPLLFCRFVMGVMMPFCGNIAYVLLIEVTEARLRPVMGVLAGLPWAFGILILAGDGYLIRSWRWLQLVSSLPGVFLIPWLLFMDESPRWLAVAGYHDKALEVLRKAARWNGTTLPSDDVIRNIFKECQDLETSSKQTKHQTVKERLRAATENFVILFRTTKLRKITAIMYVNFLVLNMVYYGLSLSGGNLSNDPYVFMALSGLMEIPAYSLTIPIVSRFGRRIPGVGSFLLSGLMLLSLIPTPKDYVITTMTLAMIGRVAISSAFQIVVFYSSELFPTEVRSRGISTSFMVGRIGSIVSPFITELLVIAFPWAPSLVFGATSMVAAVVTLTLPETQGVALPDTVASLEERADKAYSRSWRAAPAP